MQKRIGFWCNEFYSEDIFNCDLRCNHQINQNFGICLLIQGLCLHFELRRAIFFLPKYQYGSTDRDFFEIILSKSQKLEGVISPLAPPLTRPLANTMQGWFMSEISWVCFEFDFFPSGRSQDSRNIFPFSATILEKSFLIQSENIYYTGRMSLFGLRYLYALALCCMLQYFTFFCRFFSSIKLLIIITQFICYIL